MNPDFSNTAISETKPNTATTPLSRSEDWWTRRHSRILKDITCRPIDLVFIGDSITHAFEYDPERNAEDNGQETWNQYYKHRNALDIGFSGDRTQHVLWRIQNGEIEGLAPKLAVLMIGTNNSNGDDNTSEEIAAGIIAIVEELVKKLPTTNILVLGIFPREEKHNPQRAKIEHANSMVSADIGRRPSQNGGQKITYLDIGPKFLTSDGTLPKEIMPDFLHPTPLGYKIWAESMESKIVELMGEKTEKQKL